MPSAWAMAGMSRVLSGALVSFGFGDTGATTLTETGTLSGGGGSPSVPIFPAAGRRLMMTLPCVEPTSSCDVSIDTVTVAPSAGSGPLDGETVMNGLSEATLKASVTVGAFFPALVMGGMKICCVIVQLDVHGERAR